MEGNLEKQKHYLSKIGSTVVSWHHFHKQIRTSVNIFITKILHKKAGPYTDGSYKILMKHISTYIYTCHILVVKLVLFVF